MCPLVTHSIALQYLTQTVNMISWKVCPLNDQERNQDVVAEEKKKPADMLESRAR